MNNLELQKDDLQALSDDELEQLIGRLAEAEVSAQGASVGDVRFSGSITAPDGGVDVRVEVEKTPFTSGFIPRANTIFQAKKSTMPAGDVTAEMRSHGVLSEVIDQQAQLGGGYIIVSLNDDCTEPMMMNRLNAMKATLSDHPHKDNIHLDFYDRSKLHQWLRQNPSIMLWVRRVLGRPLSGWQSYQKWSSVPSGVTDDLIMAPGVSITLPGHQHHQLTIQQAITPTRKLISESNKAIRFTGLSGVGKTRFVQALFDETLGENPLDRTSVVYVDTGAEPDPSARQMIDQLVQDDRTATVVIDNCPPALHSDLAGHINSSTNQIKLITVEYDIRDDKPLTTEVVQIEAHGPEVAELLIQRRYPEISQANARKIAEFANGNTKVALALADQIDTGESLAHLSDANLFDRLFQQRHGEDRRLREHAELLSLAYSFAVETANGEPDELAVLGSIAGESAADLFRSTQSLFDRQIAQKRGRWRAILPQAIANKLAAAALNKIRLQTLRSVLENPNNARLLKSFAHRLGLLHDHPVARQIVAAWLSDDGMLIPVSEIDGEKAQLLDYVAPVCPELLLNRVEAEIMAPEFSGLDVRWNPRRTTILNMLVSMAYESLAFERCVSLLIRMAQHKDSANNYDSVCNKIVQFFQPYLSGTQASHEQRADIIRSNLASVNPALRSIGLRMLSNALDGPPWLGTDMGDFGARPRDFGYEPNSQQFVVWRHLFIDIAVEYGLDDDLDRSAATRKVLADKFRGLWDHPAVRGKLINAANLLNDQRPWNGGWKAVQSTIYFKYRTKVDGEITKCVPAKLNALEETLRPKDLISRIRAYLFECAFNSWSLDPDFDHDDQSTPETACMRMKETVTELGEQFALSGTPMRELGHELFSTNSMLYYDAFGKGLAKGTTDIKATWDELVEVLQRWGQPKCNCSVMAGYIELTNQLDRELAQSLLDTCLVNPILRSAIVSLHPYQDFSEADLDRCMQALDHPSVAGFDYGALLWRPEYSALPSEKLLQLANTLLNKPDGENVVLGALAMKLFGKDKAIDSLGLDLRRLGLIATIKQFERDQNDNSNIDYHMAKVLKSCLTHDGNDDKKASWLDVVFATVDSRCGHTSSYDNAIKVTVATSTEQFLERIFQGDERQRRFRIYFLKHNSNRRSILETADIHRVVEWCKSNTDLSIWEAVASALPVFVAPGDDNIVKLSDKCVQLLEASKNPEQVLNGFASRITPNAWGGSRAEIMERNTNALAALFDHADQEISEAAKNVVGHARIRVTAERDRERQEDETKEQTFE